jgi:hypothetical protein
MGNFDKNNLYRIKSDKEIAIVEKKTNFANFWKPIEKVNKKEFIYQNDFVNNDILKKKKKLEIIGLSYIDPSKKVDSENGKKLDNNRLKDILETKHNKLLNNFNLKIKGKGFKILSKIEKNKINKFNNEYSNMDNKTERIMSRNYCDTNENNNEDSAVSKLNTIDANKQKQKLKSILKIDVSNINKFQDNNFNNNTISSCRNTSTNGNFHHLRISNKNNSIYSNYQKGKIEKKTFYKYGIINKNYTTTDLKNINNIEEKFHHFHNDSDLNNNNNNINDENILLDKNFVENVKNLLNILKYERISDIGSNSSRKSKYQEKLDNFKENLISDLTNTINDKQGIEKNPGHRRIRSVNLNSNTFNFMNNINNLNENQISDFFIQENEDKNLKTNISFIIFNLFPIFNFNLLISFLIDIISFISF